MLEKLERAAELNEKYVLDPWDMKLKPFLKKHKETIIAAVIIGGAAYAGAVFGVKHTKIEVNIVPKPGSVIPLRVVPDPFE